MTRAVLVLQVLEAVEGGTARHLVDVVRHTPGVDHVVAVPAERVGGLTDRACLPALRAAGADVRVVPMTRSPFTATNLRALRSLRTLVREVGPDVVHTHSSIGGALARVAVGGVVYTPNGLAPGGLGRVAERALARRTERFVAVSASERDLARARHLTTPERAVLIPNGVEPEAPEPRPLRPLIDCPADVPLVGFLGRLLPQKAPEVFLAAWEELAATHPTVRGIVIGDGPQADEVRAAVGGRLAWLPELPDAAAHLHDLDVLCLPSRFEGGPYVPLEAIRAGVSVVVSDVVGNRDAIEHDVSGLVVPPEDPAALAAALRRLLADDPLRLRLADAGRAHVRAAFDVRAAGAALADLYASLRG